MRCCRNTSARLALDMAALVRWSERPGGRWPTLRLRAAKRPFDLLRVASQNYSRKLADIATEVADTGSLRIDQHG